MQVERYTFQSPYPNQVQVGKPDTSSQQQEKATNEANQISQSNNTTMQEAQNFQTQQTSEVEPSVQDSTYQIDMYA